MIPSHFIPQACSVVTILKVIMLRMHQYFLLSPFLQLYTTQSMTSKENTADLGASSSSGSSPNSEDIDGDTFLAASSTTDVLAQRNDDENDFETITSSSHSPVQQHSSQRQHELVSSVQSLSRNSASSGREPLPFPSASASTSSANTAKKRTSNRIREDKDRRINSTHPTRSSAGGAEEYQVYSGGHNLNYGNNSNGSSNSIQGKGAMADGAAPLGAYERLLDLDYQRGKPWLESTIAVVL